MMQPGVQRRLVQKIQKLSPQPADILIITVDEELEEIAISPGHESISDIVLKAARCAAPHVPAVATPTGIVWYLESREKALEVAELLEYHSQDDTAARASEIAADIRKMVGLLKTEG